MTLSSGRRPSVNAYFTAMAKLVATRSTCARRAVGCVLVDSRNRVLATGYNGVASGLPHCNEGSLCAGATAESGTRLDECQAIHAEQNALVQCRDTDAIDVCFVTVSPCMSCLKLLLNTGCRRIVFAEEYAGAAAAGALWTSTRTSEGARRWWSIEKVGQP
jgi:dCMP deaminase